MIGSILLTAILIDSDPSELATLKEPYLDRYGNAFVHFGELGTEQVLEIWKTPADLTGRQAGTQIAKGFGDPHIVGALDEETLLVRASRGEAPAQIYGFDTRSGQLRFRLGQFSELEVLDAVLSDYESRLVAIAIDDESRTDVWAIDLSEWSPGDSTTLVRVSDNTAIERDVVVSRHGGLAAWSTGTGPSTLFLSTLYKKEVQQVLRSPHMLFACDFMPGRPYPQWSTPLEELLLWEEHSLYQPGQMKSVVGWAKPSDLASVKLLTFESLGQRRLRPKVNADGTRLSVTVPGYPRWQRQAHEDAFYPVMFKLDMKPFARIFGIDASRSFLDTKFGVPLAMQRGDRGSSVVPFSNPVDRFPGMSVGNSTDATPISPDLTEVAWHPSQPHVFARLNGHYQDTRSSRDPIEQQKGWIQIYSLKKRLGFSGPLDSWMKLTKLQQNGLPFLRTSAGR